jgi:hypothetical protein
MESMGVADIIRPKNMVANLNHQSIINMKAIDWNHESSSDHIACIHLTLGMNRDITPIILHGLKHIGVMETPENVVNEDGSDGAWEHP